MPTKLDREKPYANIDVINVCNTVTIIVLEHVINNARKILTSPKTVAQLSHENLRIHNNAYPFFAMSFALFND